MLLYTRSEVSNQIKYIKSELKRINDKRYYKQKPLTQTEITYYHEYKLLLLEDLKTLQYCYNHYHDL